MMDNINKTAVPKKGLAAFARKAAAEGIVLLKNDDHMLPFSGEDRVAVFGRMQIASYRSGTGSGGAVNVAYAVSILDGLRAQKVFAIDEKLAGVYEDWIAEHPFDDGGGGWAAEPWHQEEMELSRQVLEAAAAANNKAVIVIGRTAGEDKDNSDVEGSYRLTKKEMGMLRDVCAHFDQVAVLLNVSNIIDMKWMEESGIASSVKTVMYIWQGGMEGGNAVADVLSGAVTPSGKLTDTIARDLADYPSTKNYGGDTRNIYEKDIYVGYRYFETFAPERVMFPFGYGLSYTDFVLEPGNGICDEKGKKLELEVTVKNTGDRRGKETVQVYVQAPQGRLGKPVRVLACFAKTGTLEPGGQETVRLSVPFVNFASYDDGGVTGNRSCWVLEGGEYHVYAGNSCRTDQQVFFDGAPCFLLKETLILEQLEEALAPVQPFQRIVPGAEGKNGSFAMAFEDVPLAQADLKKRILERLPKEIPFTGDRGITLQQVSEGIASLDEFIGQMSPEDLAVMVRAEGMSSPMVTPGTASAFGGVGDRLQEWGIPVACAADGPSGIRMEGGRKATQLPIGTLLAATWNVPLMEELYALEGQEMVLNQIDTLLGPGINIRRNPLNGRNFEYFSEDPLMTGAMAAAVVRGIAKSGVHATVKHFACNSQEKDRSMVDAVVSERALREIYLKGFEIAVKEGEAQSIMTSYNPVNGHWSASNYDLLTTIARREWGYNGIFMTDWWAKMNHVITGGTATIQQTGSMVRAGNDLYMVVRNSGAESNVHEDDTLEKLQGGELTMGELQQCGKNICRFLMKTPAFREGRTAGYIERTIIPREEADSEEILEDGIRIPAGGCFRVREGGSFRVTMGCVCPGNEQMQTTCRILLNGQEVSIVQINGTHGKLCVLKLVKVKLEPGCYRAGIEILKPGIQMEWLELIRK